MRKNTTASLFDDDDIPLEPVQLSSKFDEAPTDSHTTDEATTSDNGVTSDDGAASSTADTASGKWRVVKDMNIYITLF